MKLLHITIHTSKIEEEIKFYEELAGLSIVRDMRGKGPNIVFLTNAEGETCIEIIDAPEAENAGNENISIGFQSENVEKLRTELEEKGLNPSPMISPNPHVKFFFVTDPAGVKVQFM